LKRIILTQDVHRHPQDSHSVDSSVEIEEEEEEENVKRRRR
jgi:hypothetical protein